MAVIAFWVAGQKGSGGGRQLSLTLALISLSFMIASVLVGLFEPIDTPYPGPAEEDDEEDGEEEEESPEPLYFEREGYRTSEGQPTYECDSCKDDDGVEEVKLNDELRFYCGKCYGKHGGK